MNQAPVKADGMTGAQRNSAKGYEGEESTPGEVEGGKEDSC